MYTQVVTSNKNLFGYHFFWDGGRVALLRVVFLLSKYNYTTWGYLIGAYIVKGILPNNSLLGIDISLLIAKFYLIPWKGIAIMTWQQLGMAVTNLFFPPCTGFNLFRSKHIFAQYPAISKNLWIVSWCETLTLRCRFGSKKSTIKCFDLCVQIENKSPK